MCLMFACRFLCFLFRSLCFCYCVSLFVVVCLFCVVCMYIVVFVLCFCFVCACYFFVRYHVFLLCYCVRLRCVFAFVLVSLRLSCLLVCACCCSRLPAIVLRVVYCCYVVSFVCCVLRVSLVAVVCFVLCFAFV